MHSRQKYSTMERSKSVEPQPNNMIPVLMDEVCKHLQENHKLNIPSVCLPFLCRCVKQRNGDVQKTIKLILAFQKVLTDFESWNSTLKPSLYSDFYTREASYFNPLTQRDDDGRHVFLFRPEMWNPREHSFDELLSCLWMFMQYVNAHLEHVQKDGWVGIWDFNNFSMTQGLAMSLSRSLALTKWGQNGTCGKLKAAHVIHHPRIVDVVYGACKPFLNEKIKNRIIFHKSVEDLLEHVPARILPSYLKGTAGDDSYRDKSLLNEFLKHDKFFEEMINNGFPTK